MERTNNIRNRILNACQSLARNRGFYRLTVDELCREAGISKRTLYRYFASKDAIVEAVLERFMNTASAEITDILAQENDIPQLIQNILGYLVNNGQFIINPMGLDDLRRHYPGCWQKINAFRLEKIQTAIKSLYQQQPPQNWPDLRITATAVSAVVEAVLNPDFILENGYTFEEVAYELARLITSAFEAAAMGSNAPPGSH